MEIATMPLPVGRRAAPPLPLSILRRCSMQEEKGLDKLWPKKGPRAAQEEFGEGERDFELAFFLKSKILRLRDILDLPPFNAPLTLHELLLGTLEDLQKSYDKHMAYIQISDVDRESLIQLLRKFYMVLKHAGDLWIEKCCKSEEITFLVADVENLRFDQLGEVVINRLDCMNTQIKEMFNLMKDLASTFEDVDHQIKLHQYGNPLSPTSVLPELSEVNSYHKGSPNVTYLSPLLHPLQLQAVGKLKPIDMKRLSFHFFPLASDQNFRPVTQTENIANDRQLDSPDATMFLKPISHAEIRNNGHVDGDKTSEDTTLISTTIPTSLSHLTKPKQSPISSLASSPMPLSDVPKPSTPNMHQATRAEQAPHVINTNQEEDGRTCKTSEPAMLVSPKLPIIRLIASHLSSTPAPPPSPVLNGMPMFAVSPRHSTMDANAMAIDECEPSEASSFVSPSMLSAPKDQTSIPPPPFMQLNKEPRLSTTSACSQLPYSPSPLSKSASPLPPPPPKGCVLPASLPPPPPPPPPASSQLASSPLPLSDSAPYPPPPPPPKGCVLPAPPPPPPPGASSIQLPSLPSPAGSGPPPPPPLCVAKALRAKKNSTKLKRSTQMGNLYRLLKGKVEGSSLDGKALHLRKNQTGNSSGSNKAQGMADALAEMTKRSAYFRQIEEDVEKHSATILEMRSSINSFEVKDMKELLKFHKHVEQQLENLTDETQVLVRFEDFPSKKLETIRMAAALHMKMESIVTTLKGWKLAAPVAQQLNKIEGYFNKIKEEVDVIERNKEEESKRFKSHKIEFDFTALIRIKESMVDLSSDCIEMVLKETQEAKDTTRETKSKSNGNGFSKLLWRAFQLAFRVYNFAGGQDDRAERLTKDLAHEIETCQF